MFKLINNILIFLYQETVKPCYFIGHAEHFRISN